MTCDIPDIVHCANSSQPTLCPDQPSVTEPWIETENVFHSFKPSFGHRRERERELLLGSQVVVVGILLEAFSHFVKGAQCSLHFQG